MRGLATLNTNKQRSVYPFNATKLFWKVIKVFTIVPWMLCAFYSLATLLSNLEHRLIII
jgi:hypothetical protein